MDRAEFVSVVHRLLDFVDRRATTLAAEAFVNVASEYTDPGRWALERSRLFGSLPLVAGFGCELAAPGAYAARELAGVPVLLVRGEDGSVRAFLNVCRHRGSRVASGCGTSKRFVCPFHGWTYDNAGRLTGMPGREGFAGIDPATLSLAPLPVAERHGLVFVRLDPTADPIDVEAHLGDLGPRLAAWGLERYRGLGAKVIDAAVNWKVALDTYTEGYHFATVHSTTVAQFQPSNIALVETHGPHHRIVFPMLSIGQLREQPADTWEPIAHTNVIHGLFPHAVLSLTGMNAELWCVFPGRDVGHSITLHHYAAPPGPDEMLDMHRAAFDFSHQIVEGEDYAQASLVQASLATGLQEHVIYGRNEPALQHLHRALAAAVGEVG